MIPSGARAATTSALARKIAARLGVLAAYFGVAVIRTFPLIARSGTSLPARHTDVFGFVWNNWWLFHAAVHRLSKPYLTTAIFAPFRIDLRLHTAGFLNALLSIPVFPWLGQVGVLNLQVFAAIVLNGYATFLLARSVVRDASIGFLCGLLIAATEAINFHLGSGRPSCAALWPAIFAVYFLLRVLDAPTLRTSSLCAVFTGAMFLMDQQVALFGSGWLALVGLDALLRRGRSLLRRPVLMAVALPALVGAIAAYLLYFRAVKYDVGYTVPGADEAIHYSPGIEFFGSPTLLWLTYGTVLPIAAFVGLLLVRRLPEIRAWAIGAWAFLVLTMGPVIHGTRIPLPFALVRHLPGMAQFRFPYRFQMGAVLGAAIALGILLARARSRIRRARFTLVFAGIVAVAVCDLVGNRAASGFPLRTAPPPEPVYDVIARDHRDCLVLEIPVAVRTGTDRIGRWTDAPGEALTFYQPTHGKRLINGFAARAPIAALDYYRASPALMFLAEEVPPAGDVLRDLQEKLVELDVGYVVVHPPMLRPDRLPEILQLLDQAGGLERLPDSGDLIAFRRPIAER